MYSSWRHTIVGATTVYVGATKPRHVHGGIYEHVRFLRANGERLWTQPWIKWHMDIHME